MEEGGLIVAGVSHKLCEILKVYQELEFKSDVHIGQISGINVHGDEYKRRGELEKPDKSWLREKLFTFCELIESWHGGSR